MFFKYSPICAITNIGNVVSRLTHQECANVTKEAKYIGIGKLGYHLQYTWQEYEAATREVRE